jgi:hypothetical protein
MTTKTHRFRPRLLAVVALAAVGVLMAAAPAFADTSQASATAVQLSGLLSGSTGVTSATNDGTQPTVTNSATPLLSLLGTQSLVSAGALTQVAQATNTGTSTACAGATGAGGLISVGQPGQCNVTAGTGAVSVAGVLTANAIVASCSATSSGTRTGSATLAGVTALAGGITIPVNPAANTVITVPLLATITLNGQTLNPDGSITVTALKVDLVNVIPGQPSLQSLTIGHVTCGPNAKTSPIPTFPLKGLPVAGGVVALAGGAVYYRRRRAASKAVA